MNVHHSVKKHADWISRYLYHSSFGLLLIRAALGLIFFVHGVEKWQHMEVTTLMMTFLQLGGAPTAYFIVALEVVGGAALILGVATRLFGILFGIEMLVAAVLVGSARGFHGYEFTLLLSAASFGIALIGAGKYCVYALECRNCHGFFCNGDEANCKNMS